MRIGNFGISIPPVTLNLLLINIVVYLLSRVLALRGIDVIDLFGLHYFGASGFGLWQLVTYMFLHSLRDLSHLFFNMFALWMFGSAIEQAWGQRRYLLYYFATGIGAALAQELVWSLSIATIPPEFYNYLITVGASGAIFGILLAFGMTYPNVPMYILFIPIPIRAKWVVLGYGIIELLAGVTPIGHRTGVAHFAHLGGMVFGLILILAWRYADKHRKQQDWGR